MAYLKNIVGLALLALIMVFYVITYWLITRKKVMPKFRTLPGLLALDEIVGRATEMGRPVLHSTGRGALYSSGVGTTLASFVIYGEVARRCAKMKTELITAIGTAEHIPIIQSIAENAYRSENALEELKYENFVFVGGSQSSSNARIFALLEQRKPASFIVTGGYGADLCTLGGAGRAAGCLSLCGTTNTYQYPYAVAAYDYWLIGEDFLATAAAISKDPPQVANIWAGDLFRFLLVGLIVIGVVLAWLGFNISEYLTI